MIRRVTSAGGILYKESQVLLVRHKEGWGFPKGHIEEGETPETTAVREIREETGESVVVVNFLGSLVRPSIEYGGSGTQEDVEKEILIFGVESTGEEAVPHEPNSQPEWVHLELVAAGMRHREDAEFFVLHVLPWLNAAAGDSITAS